VSEPRRSLRLLQQGGFYIGSLFALRAGNFLLLPLYTALLSADEYGAVGVVQKLVELLVLVAIAGQGQALIRLGTETPTGIGRLLSSQLVFVGLSALFLTGLAAGAWPWIAPAMGGSPLWPVGLAGLVGVAGTTLFYLELSALQLRGQAGRHAALTVAQWATGVLGFLVLVMLLDLGAAGLLLATSLSFTLFAAIGWRSMPEDTALRLERSVLRPSLRFGIPIVPHALAGVLLGATDRAVVAHELGLGEAGIYVLAANLSSAVFLVAMGAQRAWLPFFLREDREREGSEWGAVPRIALAIHGLVMFTAAGVGLAAPEIVAVFTDVRFGAASTLIPVLVGGQMIRTFYMTNMAVVLTERRTARWLVGITLPAALLNLVLNLVCVPRWGALGAAWATAIAFGSTVLLSELLARRARRVSFLRAREGAMVLAVAVALTAGYGRAFPVRFGLGVGVVAVLWLLLGRDVLYAWRHVRAARGGG
jgi:O-antigen/teichoic acid export membrane protein